MAEKIYLLKSCNGIIGVHPTKEKAEKVASAKRKEAKTPAFFVEEWEVNYDEANKIPLVPLNVTNSNAWKDGRW